MASSPQIRSATPAVSPAPIEIPRSEERSSALAEMECYRQLIARTVDAFGDEKIASRWLSLPCQDFGGCTPLEVAQRSGYDPESIEPVLLRIEHGVDF